MGSSTYARSGDSLSRIDAGKAVDREPLFSGCQAVFLDNTSTDLANSINYLMQVQPSPKTSPSSDEPLLPPRKPGWRVVLGRTAWSRYTYERPEGDDLQLLGSVHKGAQIGALAMTVEGAYVQVVGDHLAPLKTREIAKALANAPRSSSAELSRETPPWLVASKASPAPVVIVKKRRVAVMP